MRKGLPSNVSFWSPVNRTNEAGSSVIWLKLMSTSRKLCNRPIDFGSSFNSVKLDERSRLVRFGSEHKLSGTVSSWLKCTSSCVKLVSEDMVVGKLLRLLRCTDIRCNDTRWPIASGNAFNLLKSAFNSTSEVQSPIVHGNSSIEFFWIFRVAKLVRHPRASGNLFNWFDWTSRRTSLANSPIDSGISCNSFPAKKCPLLKEMWFIDRQTLLRKSGDGKDTHFLCFIYLVLCATAKFSGCL